MAVWLSQPPERRVLPLSCEAIGNVSRFKIRKTFTSSFCACRAELPLRLHRPPHQPTREMDQETLGSVVLLAIVTLISVVQNGKMKISIYLRAKRELRKVQDDVC